MGHWWHRCQVQTLKKYIVCCPIPSLEKRILFRQLLYRTLQNLQTIIRFSPNLKYNYFLLNLKYEQKNPWYYQKSFWNDQQRRIRPQNQNVFERLRDLEDCISLTLFCKILGRKWKQDAFAFEQFRLQLWKVQKGTWVQSASVPYAYRKGWIWIFAVSQWRRLLQGWQTLPNHEVHDRN